jgi:CubicO group peptidase (beta-lactamase class C family)
VLTAAGRTVRPGFEPVADAFEDVLAHRQGFGASLCVYADGLPQVDLWGGDGYRADSLQVVFSATKGAMAVCAALLVQRGLLDLDAPVASIWPEFGQAGKEHVPVRWLLSHRAGLPTVDQPLRLADLYDTPTLVAALERQKPYWEPGTAHGYHAWTIGTLVGEVVRRVDGRTLGRFFAEEVAAPLGLDFWIGLPEELEARVIPLRQDAVSMTEAAPAILAALADPSSLPSRVINNGLTDLTQGCNQRDYHAAEAPAATGIGSARALAAMYAACIGPAGGTKLLDPTVVDEFTQPQSDGLDLVALEHTRFGLGFMLPFPRLPMAGPTSFGHDGAGGALALADRDSGLSFAFLTDRFPARGGADPAAHELMSVVLNCRA